MTNILLVCQGGMSSSFLVKKIHEAFTKNQEEIQIISKASMEIVDYIDWADIILVSPSVLYCYGRDNGSVPGIWNYPDPDPPGVIWPHGWRCDPEIDRQFIKKSWRRSWLLKRNGMKNSSSIR